MPADMNYADFKTVYVDKTATLKAWQITRAAGARLTLSAEGLKSAGADGTISAGTGANRTPEAPVQSGDERIRQALQATMTEYRIKGELAYPPPSLDVTNFKFDAEHTQGDKHPHDVTEEEARRFIAEAYFAIIRNTNSVNYFSEAGAAYVRTDMKKIRTAFKKEEYAPPYKKMIEVYSDARRDLQN